jgi:hypothetical protein
MTKTMHRTNKFSAQKVYFHEPTMTWYREKPCYPESELIKFDSILECKTYIAILKWGKAFKIELQPFEKIFPAQGNYPIWGWKADFRIYCEKFYGGIVIEAKGKPTAEFKARLRAFKHVCPLTPVLFVSSTGGRIDAQHNSVKPHELGKVLDLMIANPGRSVEIAGMRLEV